MMGQFNQSDISVVKSGELQNGDRSFQTIPRVNGEHTHNSRSLAPARRSSFKRHSPMEATKRPMYTVPEKEEPFMRQVTRELIILGGYRDIRVETSTRVLRPVWQKDVLVERLTNHIQDLNDLVESHSRRLRSKQSFGKRLVSILLFKPPPKNAGRFEDATSPCTSSDPFDHLKMPNPLFSDHLPLSQQYYQHLFDMVDYVPALNEDIKSMICKGYAQAQAIECDV